MGLPPLPETPPAPAPPRAFTQGVGTVYQVAGVSLFLFMSFGCCGSALLSRDWAMQAKFTKSGWDIAPDVTRNASVPDYSVARAMTVCVFAGVFFGVALAAVGLGLQAQRPAAARGAVVLCALGVLFWVFHTWFAMSFAQSISARIVAATLSIAFLTLLGLAVGAVSDMTRHPPPLGFEILPADYKIPYSHYHVDPPEVRLAAELDQRRQRLAVQQKELEMLEEKLKRKLDEGSGD